MNIQLVEGVGLIDFSVFEAASTNYTGWPSRLRYAEVGGETYGSPLDIAESVTPFAAGNVWVYAVDSTVPEAPDHVIWTAEEGDRLVVSQETGGVTSVLGECLVSIQAATAPTTWVRSVTFADAPEAMCPTSISVLPRRVRYAAAPFQNGYEVPELTPDQMVTVGSTTLTTATFSQEYVRYQQTAPNVLTSSFTVADGLGITRFANTESGSSTAELVYARVGGETYGENPVSTASGETPWTSQTFDVRLGPNPAVSATTIRVQGRTGERARVSVFDGLGRRVRTHEVVLPGETRIDTADLSAGVYVVRVEAGEEISTRRLVVTR